MNSYWFWIAAVLLLHGVCISRVCLLLDIQQMLNGCYIALGLTFAEVAWRCMISIRCWMNFELVLYVSQIFLNKLWHDLDWFLNGVWIDLEGLAPYLDVFQCISMNFHVLLWMLNGRWMGINRILNWFDWIW